MYDVWDVIGLNGTGTDSYSVDNLFIPEKFAALRDEPEACRENGPLYKLPTNMVFSMGFAATSLGVARATLDAAIDLARAKTPQGHKAMRENNAVQGVIGRTEASLRATRAYLYATAAEVWRDLSRGEAFTETHRFALRMASTWTIHQSPRWSIPPITWPAPPPCSMPTRSSAAFATCTPSRSRSRAATPLRGCRQGDPVRQSRWDADDAMTCSVILRTGHRPCC